MKIVTSGLVFLDIDAYAGCVAYAELLRLQGHDAIAYSSATMNGSIPATIRSWDVALQTAYQPSDSDTFILIDVSEPDFLDKAVSINKVEEVIDHHLGSEDFWREKIGDKTNIEFVGAACTQVYEKWQDTGLLNKMSEKSARLLVSGILDNTLNFKASVTTDRDHKAHEALSKIANLPHDWAAQYFSECEASIFGDIKTALLNDTKTMRFPNYEFGELIVGQLVVWNAERAIQDYRSVIEDSLAAKSDNWFVNIVSIKDGHSSFVVSNSLVQSWLGDLLNLEFTNGLATADRLWLRKEIMKQSIQFKNQAGQ